jgi:uncharacterized protein YjgD (DUF1641 family)
LENFIQNVIDVTEVGGYFIGTSYDGKRMFKFLEKIVKNDTITFNYENGEKMWEVHKMYPDEDTFEDNVESLGMQIDIYQDTIGSIFKEYLVNFDYFKLVMEQYGFVTLNKDELIATGFTKSIGSFKDLHTKLNDELKSGLIDQSNIGNATKMSDNEQSVSFMNNYFIFKKIRHEISNVALLGSKINNNDDDVDFQLK